MKFSNPQKMTDQVKLNIRNLQKLTDYVYLAKIIMKFCLLNRSDEHGAEFIARLRFLLMTIRS